MPSPVPLDRELVTWQLFYLFALHASAINNFATLLLRYSASLYYTRISFAKTANATAEQR